MWFIIGALYSWYSWIVKEICVDVCFLPGIPPYLFDVDGFSAPTVPSRVRLWAELSPFVVLSTVDCLDVMLGHDLGNV